MDTRTDIRMIAVPPGRVTLSDRRTRRSWAVELEPYGLGAFPVTQALYARITGERPGSVPGDGLPVEGVSCRASARRRSHPTFRVDDVGFRLARSAAP